MKKFKLKVYHDAFVDNSDYYPIKLLPMNVNHRLENLCEIFNANVFGEEKGVFYGRSQKPLLYFPVEFILTDNRIIITDDLEEFKSVLVEYYDTIKQVGRFGTSKKFLLKNIDYLNEYTRYPHFLELFTYSLELDYNTGILLSEYLTKPPFYYNAAIYLYHPDELKYASITELLYSKELEYKIPNFDAFAREAENLIDYYNGEISKFMNDPYRMVKVDYSSGLAINLNVELVPSIMEKWGLISKELMKG